MLTPITDICIVLGKTQPPPGFRRIEFSVDGQSGSVCGGVLTKSIWICTTRVRWHCGGVLCMLLLCSPYA